MLFRYKQVPVSHGIVHNNSILTFFFMMEERKLTRNDIFDNKEHEEVVPGPEQEKLVLGSYKESSRALIGQ